jgi:ATP-dependent RNA helicase RhlE
VFNFDVPIQSEDYVHRIGRTGRAGRKGWAFMMCLPHEQKHLDGIEALVKHEIPRLEMEAPKSTRPERKERPKKERAPKPEAAKPETAKPVEAENKPVETQAPKPAKENKNPRNPKGQGKAVKGLGDHVPAFLLR